MKKDKSNINTSLNLPIYDDADDNELSYQLFHCCKCGIHPKAYSITSAKGYEDQTLTKLLRVLPGDIKVLEVFGEILPDTEVVEMVFCGKCGSAGSWTTIPAFLLETLGMLKPVKSGKDNIDEIHRSKNDQL